MEKIKKIPKYLELENRGGAEIYLRDIFYKDDFNLEQGLDVINSAKKLSDYWRTDILDCVESLARQICPMSWKDIIKKIKDCDSNIWRVILRRGYNKEHFGEVVVRLTGGKDMGEYIRGVDYFLWIWMTKENFEKLIKKFKLEETL